MHFLKLFGIAAAMLALTCSFSYGSEDPTLGISRELARARSKRYRDIRYRVSFKLTPGAELLEGDSEITLTIAEPIEPMVIDFKGLGDRETSINGKLRSV